MKNSSGNKNKDFLVVGIGASAGGINALKTFFENVPKDSGMAYVVILHLSPDFESKLAEILQATAKIPVNQIKDARVRIEPNCVYVIPPNKRLEMVNGYLKLSKYKRKEERRSPVDIFFRTLAETKKERAVSVILSGTGPNGSMGMKHIKEKGGVCIVQSPTEAEYSEMPNNSIATGLVDYILPVAEIPEKVLAYRENQEKVKISPESDEQPENLEQLLGDVFTHLRIRTGHDFSSYKRATVMRRIERRMNVRQITELSSYAGFMESNPEESQMLLKDLLISVTNFFRDREAFEALERDVIPKVLEGKTSDGQVRIWVTGCATGEEAYSLAILLSEQTAKMMDAPQIQIFASDIDENAIAKARSGFYTNSDLADVSPERLKKFFREENDGFRVRRELREMILFAVHNVTKDPPFSHLDLATCRNLLIYLNRTAQSRVLETIHFALNPGGYLLLGTSESIDGATDLFAPVDKENNIYQSRPIASRALFPIPDLLPSVWLNKLHKKSSEEDRIEEIRALERLSFTALHHQLLESYAPPSVVVNEEYDIVHLSESAGKYMKIAGGEPTMNLLRVILPELRLELRTALYRAVQQKTSVIADNLQVTINGKTETINIIVRPILHKDDPQRGFTLVLFEHAREAAKVRGKLLKTDEPIARQLEEELVRTKSQLRATVEQCEIQQEELKASNEELQAINEELRSSAEELETSREELQSVNEELTTVNQELKIKIEELSQSNNDFQNLMNSTDIGTIFLDRSLRIKMFTPPVQNVYNIIKSDVGRPLSHIKSRFEYDGLQNDIEIVIDKLIPVEREIKSDDNCWYVIKIFPYRTSEDRIKGVIIKFLDITKRRQIEKKLEKSLERLAVAMNAGKIFFWDLDISTQKVKWSDNTQRILGFPLPEDFQEAVKLVDEDDRKSLLSVIPVDDTEKDNEFEAEYRLIHPTSAKIFWLRSLGTLNIDEDGEKCLLGISQNITGHKEAEEKLRRNEEHLQLILNSVKDYAIFTMTKDGIIDSWNPGAENMFGYTKQEILGRPFKLIFTPEDRENSVPEQKLKNAAETGRVDSDHIQHRKNGERFMVGGVLSPIYDKDRLRGFVKVVRDQTEKIKVQKAIHEREMLQQFVKTQEDERRRVARDLHDHLGQRLTALRLHLETIRKVCGDNGDLCIWIEKAQFVAEQLDREVDFLAWELRPAALDQLGLEAALANYVSEWSHYSGIQAEFHTAGLGKMRLKPEIEINLYRIAQEALNNIIKHAKAENVSVMLKKRDGSVVLIVEDDGVGFDSEAKKKSIDGLGLIGMSERADYCKGKLEIESAPDKGTTLFIIIPLSHSDVDKQNIDG